IHQPPQELSIPEMEDLKQQYLDELQRSRKAPSKRLLSFCFDDDDEDYTSAITPDEPVLSTEEPDNSLSMGDEHLDTIPATESNQFIKSGVETLISILNESEGIPKHVCDIPFHDNSPPLDVSKDTIEDFSESNEEFSSTDDDSFSFYKIEYVEASPPDSELVSSEVMEIVILEVGGIKASNDNPIPSYDPIIYGTPLNLTPSGESDFFSEVDAFLAVKDESTSYQFPKSNLDPKGDMLLFEAFLNDDHSFDSQTKSSSTSLNSLLEETHIFHNSLPGFTTFSNVLFDTDYDSDSSDDQSLFDEDTKSSSTSLNSLLEETHIFHNSLPGFTTFSNVLFDADYDSDSSDDQSLSNEEIIPMEIDPHSFNAESDLIESMPNNDSSIIIPSKIDSLFDEFAGELTLLKSIPRGIDETDCHLEEEICLTKRLLYDNSYPCPPEEIVSDNSNADIKSFSLSPILIKDSDSHIEEINLSLNPDEPNSRDFTKDVVEDISLTKGP
nr:hypothetical protein [Tanacetum cinerariifolium]